MFCRFASTPDDAPSPGISGKLNEKPTASCMPNSLPFSRPVIASTDSCLLRSSQFFTFTKIVALFGWLARLRMSKPASATMFFTADSWRRNPSTRSTTAVVRWSDAASGSCTRDREVALVLGGDERARHDAPEDRREPDDHHHRGEPRARPAEHAVHRARIALGEAREAAIERAEEAGRVRLRPSP